jgi:transcription factor SPN1
MDLDTTTLKESRLGPIVLFYTKTKRVTPSINRAADALVQAWSRPIIKRPANFRSRQLDMVDGEGEDGYEGRGGRDGEGENGWSQGRGGSQQESQSQGQGMGGSQERRRRFDARKAIEENRGRKGARMPVIKVGQVLELKYQQR